MILNDPMVMENTLSHVHRKIHIKRERAKYLLFQRLVL